MTRGKFTVNEVEERTKVPASTLRQWERRYGFPKPERSDAGYRLYSDLDLGHIDAMKRHIAQGIPASRAAQLVRAGSPRPDGVRSVPALGDELAAALIAFDEERATQVLGEAFSLHPVEVVAGELVGVAMRRLGEMESQGAVEAAVLNMAAGVLQARLHSLLQHCSPVASAPVVLVACAPGDVHAVGPLALSLLLRRRGYRAHFLGAVDDLQDLTSLASRLNARALLIAAATDRSLRGLERLLPSSERGRAVLGFGGPAFDSDPGAAVRCGGVHLGTTLVESADRLRYELEFREVA